MKYTINYEIAEGTYHDLVCEYSYKNGDSNSEIPSDRDDEIELEQVYINKTPIGYIISESLWNELEEMIRKYHDIAD